MIGIEPCRHVGHEEMVSLPVCCATVRTTNAQPEDAMSGRYDTPVLNTSYLPDIASYGWRPLAGRTGGPAAFVVSHLVSMSYVSTWLIHERLAIRC